MSKSGFVYIWFDRKRNRFYIGSHWGYEHDGYICSSKWMRDAYRQRPNDFKRRILARGLSDRKCLLEKEQEFLDKVKPEELRKRYYNLSKVCFGNFTYKKPTGNKLSEETKQKIREARAKQVISEETKEKIRQANLKREYGESFKASAKRGAMKKSKENLFGGKIGKNGMLGKTHSVETKRNMSASAKYKVSCPHCGKVGSANPMRRWHFNNCKHLTGVS